MEMECETRNFEIAPNTSIILHMYYQIKNPHVKYRPHTPLDQNPYMIKKVKFTKHVQKTKPKMMRKWDIPILKIRQKKPRSRRLKPW